MKIHGIEGMSFGQIEREVSRGAKFVTFMWCISIIIMTFRRGTDVHFIRAGQGSLGKSIGWTLLTLIVGWWGFPWGPIYSLQALFTNLKGGKDVTSEILAALPAAAQSAPRGI